MKKLIAVILTLALLSAVCVSLAEQATATLPAGVKMGINPDELEAAMGTEPDDEYDVTNTVYEVDYEITFAGNYADAGFIFLRDSLTMIGIYNFDEIRGENIDVLKQEMTAAYGASTDVSSETISTVFTLLAGEDMDPGFFRDGSAWNVDDATVVWVFMLVSEEANIRECFVVYVSRDYLETAGTPADAPKDEPVSQTDDIPSTGEAELQGTWTLTDARNADGSTEDIGEVLEMLKSGEMTQTYTFRNGELVATMSIPSYGIDQTIAATYRIEGNTIIVTETDESGAGTDSDPVAFKVDGDTLELTDATGLTLIFARLD